MNDDKERARIALEDAVLRALEKGFDPDEVMSEVEYILETADE